MMKKWIAAAAVALAVMYFAPGLMQAQGGAALRGVVTSQEEGKMEGVVVTARAEGANFDVSVVSDASGKYSFPGTHIKPGQYSLKIRAVGYDLSGPAMATVAAGKTATADLKLQKTADLSKQLSSTEWAMSIPGSDQDKYNLLRPVESCTYCHSLERIVKSKHTEEEFMGVINRMARYYPDGSMAGTEGRGRSQINGPRQRDAADKNPEWGSGPYVKKTDLARYLASFTGKVPDDLKTLPRPKGKGTRVIITEYDMPRKDTVSHDSDMDRNGNFWYTDESRPFVGRFDTKTSTFKEWPMPAAPAGEVSGCRDIIVDDEGNPWFPIFLGGGQSVVHKFDVKTEQVTKIEGAGGQFMAKGPDGKIWVGFTRIDPKTMKVDGSFTEDFVKAPDAPKGQNFPYQNVVSTKGNPYGTAFVTSYIVTVDTATHKARFIPTPTRDALPRRGHIDGNRFWFAEYDGDRLAMIDTNTDKITEWPIGIKFSSPYTMSAPDAKGRVYASSNTMDRVFRLDPKTGEIVHYQIPVHDFDAKKISVAPDGKSVWMSNTRNARVVKVEPLD